MFAGEDVRDFKAFQLPRPRGTLELRSTQAHLVSGLMVVPRGRYIAGLSVVCEFRWR